MYVQSQAKTVLITTVGSKDLNSHISITPSPSCLQKHRTSLWTTVTLRRKLFREKRILFPSTRLGEWTDM